MNSLIAFGALLFSCVVAISNGQGYIRLSRTDPMMSTLLHSKNIPNESSRNVYEDIDAENEPGADLMKRGSRDVRKNFLNFIFRKYPEKHLETRDKRLVDQHPIMMETYLQPYVDYLED